MEMAKEACQSLQLGVVAVAVDTIIGINHVGEVDTSAHTDEVAGENHLGVFFNGGGLSGAVLHNYAVLWCLSHGKAAGQHHHYNRK